MLRTSRFVVVACLIAFPALAQSPEDRAAAQALFDQGAALMQKGDHAAACPKLEASLQRFDGIGTRGKLAQCYEALGRVASAWAMYREVAALAAKAGDEQRASFARTAAEKLAPRVPKLTIEVPQESRVPGLSVRRNGAAIAEGAWGAPVAVDPGEQSLEASAPGHASFNEKLTLAEGEQRSFEIPALEATPEASPAATPATTEAPTPAADPAPASSTPWRPIAAVTAGVGIVSLAVGGYFGLRASSKWNSAFDDGHCSSSDNKCNAEGQELTDDARSAATLSNVFIGAGAVLTGAGIALWFLAPEDARAEARVRVIPVAERDRGGVWVRGSF